MKNNLAKTTRIATLTPPRLPIGLTLVAPGWPRGGVSASLTKKHLLTAAAGRFLVSNLLSCGESIFAEAVADSLTDRIAQWERVVRAGANHRLCYMYESKQEFERQRAESGWPMQTLQRKA